MFKMSLRISYYTKFFLNYGAICNALTRKDNNVYTIPSTFLLAKYCYNFARCSRIIFSLINSLPYTLPSFMIIL